MQQVLLKTGLHGELFWSSSEYGPCINNSQSALCKNKNTEGIISTVDDINCDTLPRSTRVCGIEPCVINHLHVKSDWSTEDNNCYKLYASQIISRGRGGQSCTDVARNTQIAQNHIAALDTIESVNEQGSDGFIYMKVKGRDTNYCKAECQVTTDGLTVNPFQKMSDGSCVQTSQAKITQRPRHSGVSCSQAIANNSTLSALGSASIDENGMVVNFSKSDATKCQSCTLYPFEDSPWEISNGNCVRTRRAAIQNNLPTGSTGQTCAQVVQSMTTNFVPNSASLTNTHVSIQQKDDSRESCKRSCKFTGYTHTGYRSVGESKRCIDTAYAHFNDSTKELAGGKSCSDLAREMYPGAVQYVTQPNQVMIEFEDTTPAPSGDIKMKCLQDCLITTPNESPPWLTTGNGECVQTFTLYATKGSPTGVPCETVVTTKPYYCNAATEPNITCTLDASNIRMGETADGMSFDISGYVLKRKDSTGAKCSQPNDCRVSAPIPITQGKHILTPAGSCIRSYLFSILSQPRQGGKTCVDAVKGFSDIYVNGDSIRLFPTGLQLDNTNVNMCPIDCYLDKWEDRPWALTDSNTKCVKDHRARIVAASKGTTAKTCLQLATIKRNELGLNTSDSQVSEMVQNGANHVVIRRTDPRARNLSECKSLPDVIPPPTYSFKTGEWGNCVNGLKLRSVICEKKTHNAPAFMVNIRECIHLPYPIGAAPCP
jgi:hypothetical protein